METGVDLFYLPGESLQVIIVAVYIFSSANTCAKANMALSEIYGMSSDTDSSP